jgi:squalene-associated FAD-dependent desaturase
VSLGTRRLDVAIIGAGWAGMAAAVEATRAGHAVTVFEASRQTGGRARALPGVMCNGQPITVDNGQHILIGAYTESLRLMRWVGVNPKTALLRLPMTLRFADGGGLRLPRLPAPFNLLLGVLGARGWLWADKTALLKTAQQWRKDRFQCDASLSVAALCEGLPQRILTELIEPLCVSALNTPPAQASAQVFLRVLGDALFGVPGGSHLLLPRVDLSALFPEAAARWLVRHGGHLALETRVNSVLAQGSQWRVQGQLFDAAIFATTPTNAALTLDATAFAAPESIAKQIHAWRQTSRALQFEPIATVYAWGAQARLSQPMVGLRSQPGAADGAAPAQFVFDRGQLGGPPGLLAFVASASRWDAATVQRQVLQQAQDQLGLRLQAVQTVAEKRATFACTPGLQRPPLQIAPSLLACGDYVEGPYPATLEGAVRSAIAAVKAL